MLGTAAAYATVDSGGSSGPHSATSSHTAVPADPTSVTADSTDGSLEPVRLHRVYRVPFAQLAASGGR